MRARVGVLVGFSAWAAGAAAWDAAVAPARGGAGGPAPGTDGTLELAWDNGSPSWHVSWLTGAGVWVGNDFSIATLSAYRRVKQVRVYSGPAWPNGHWDGWRLGLYSFASGAPGSLIWGPAWVQGSATGYAWANFGVDWVLPAANLAFTAAIDQVYNHPNTDAFMLDTNTTFRGHSWFYYQGSWSPMHTGLDPYRNLMLRVVVDNTSYPGVVPSSWGRLKALYY